MLALTLISGLDPQATGIWLKCHYGEMIMSRVPIATRLGAWQFKQHLMNEKKLLDLPAKGWCNAVAWSQANLRCFLTFSLRSSVACASPSPFFIIISISKHPPHLAKPAPWLFFHIRPPSIFFSTFPCCHHHFPHYICSALDLATIVTCDMTIHQ